jgi:hypothetical protein
MVRRQFLAIVLPVAFAGTLMAFQKPDRLSGVVRQVDKTKMVIEITLSSNPSSVRKIHYDANTKFTFDKKPAQADVVKDGLRIVAIGKFEGVDLKATDVSLRNR